MNEENLMNEMSVIGQNGAAILSNNGAGVVGQNGAAILSNNGAGVVGQNGAAVLSNNGGSILSNNGANSKGPDMMPNFQNVDLGDLHMHRMSAGGVTPPVQGMPPAMGIISDRGNGTVTGHTGDVFTSHEDAIIANNAGR